MSLPILNYGASDGTSSARIVPREDQSAVVTTLTGSQSTSRNTGNAAKGKPPRPNARKKQASRQPRRNDTKGRSSAVYRVVERLLESEVRSDSELLEAVQLFTGLELLQVAEERALQNLCGNPVCDGTASPLSAIDRLTLDDNAMAPHAFCSSECDLKIRRLASRLGNEEAAISRYTHITAGGGSTAFALHPSQPPSSRASLEQKFAAGGVKTPIMLAQVQEREFPQPPAPPSGNGSSAVEGFAPRRQPTVNVTPANLGDTEMGEASATPDELSAEPIHGLQGFRQSEPVAARTESGSAARSKQDDQARSDDEDNASVAERFELEHLDFAPPDSSSGEDEFEADREGEAGTEGVLPWLEEAPVEGRGMRLSTFGQVHDALDCLFTDASLEFCRGRRPRPTKASDDRQRQVLGALQHALGVALNGELSRALRLSVQRTAIDKHLVELLHTFDLHGPVPSMKSGAWRLLALVLLKALSMERLPQLRSSFEGPEALARLSALLAEHRLDLDHFSCLLELVLSSE